MCGITAFKGNKALMHVVSATLAQLDRGISGSGYAWINKNHIWYIKSPIHPLKLAVLNNYFVSNNAQTAIGHNRMPSQGKISYYNCHPFIDCYGRFALVHNGTFTFSQEVQKRLSRDHRIKGETDSEILTHLICEQLNKRRTMYEILSDYAKDWNMCATIIILTRNNELYALKDWQPLHLFEISTSKYGKFYALASEESAIETALFKEYLKANKKFEMKHTALTRGDLIHINANNELTLTPHTTKYTWKINENLKSKIIYRFGNFPYGEYW